MLTRGLLDALPELPRPVLTIYLNTNRENPANRALEPGYLINLGSQATRIEEKLHPDERKPFREQVERAEAYLRTHTPRSKGLLIFAGKDTWEVAPLNLAIEDELHWGAPDLAQLLWLLEEYKPYGIVVVNRKRAQFFLNGLGEMLELEEMECTLRPSKEKEMGPVARSFGVRVSRGTNRDVFEHHRNAQFQHYRGEIAQKIENWCHAEHLQSLFLLGLPEMIIPVQKAISPALHDKVVLVEHDLGWASKAELILRIESIVSRHERESDLALVNALLGDGRGPVVGIDETLARLQQGQVRALVVVKKLDASLKQCSECLWVDRTVDPICPACGRERHSLSLREALPELIRRHNVSLQVVSGEAGDKLQEAGGMGAWLREFERKEYGEHLTFA